MCIVSLINNGNDFILTHNRDENINRKSSDELKTTNINSTEITYPEDLQSYGTWICSSEKYVAAILNGGFYNHTRKKEYRMSRGKIIFELFRFHSIVSFVSTYNFKGIEPFTMLIIDLKTHKSVYLIWDENKPYIFDASTNHQPIILLSSTLYNENEKYEKKINFLKNMSNCHNSEDIYNWHFQNKMDKNNTPFEIETVSITQIITTNNKSKIKYQKIQA